MYCSSRSIVLIHRQRGSSATRAAISSSTAAVSGALVQQTRRTPGSTCFIASMRWTIPFWRVVRPTNRMYGPSMP